MQRRSEKPFRSMKLVTCGDYKEFVERNSSVTIGDVEIRLKQDHQVGRWEPPSDYKLESTTVWSFPDRGDWASHRGDYRGNWSPYIPRNLILKYSQPGEWVLDQMMGGGTTLIECRLLGRNVIGVDVNLDSVMLTMDRMRCVRAAECSDPEALVYHGDARSLDKVEEESIDLIATHPPYWGIIPYSKASRVGQEGDLSAVRTLDEYLEGMRKVAEESYRVLRQDRFCGLLIGDTRVHRHYVPISHRILQVFLDAGFILAEDIIKMQHRMKATREKWRHRRFELYRFHRIYHEHLYVFRKPSSKEKLGDYRYSRKWW